MDLKNRITDRAIVRRKPLLSLQESAKVKRELDAFLDTKIDEWNRTVPFARHLEGAEVNLPYYRQTLMEHAWRIRLMRSAQCNNLHKISRINAEAAQRYAAYQDEEMLHDTLFIQDAERIGVTQEEIYRTEPSFYTRLLAGYLYFVAEHEKPLGVVCYSYLVEYTTQKITPKQIAAMADSLGKDKIAGQAAHLNTDLVEDHTQEMWDILHLLIESEQDIVDIKRYFSEIQELLKLFFVELYEQHGKATEQAA
ncbi:iron-containing redox enzyme family protein [Aeromonas rivuli]|uniref:iron-containing redox enzyme family protein n=1 Tax=Aeromonas rivuli TaxID=648794 RepID=UPI0005A91D3A|nr:iron-containing redox enzyme family protein [Aeromonas rivuli]